MHLLLVLFACALAVERQGVVSVGSASVTFDLTGLAPDVSISACDAATYSNQGGRVVTLTVSPTNFREPCTFNMVEGGVATASVSVQLYAGATVTVPRAQYISSLTVHVENYNPAAAGNTYCIALRASASATDPEPNVFRYYCDSAVAAGSNRVPLVLLTGGVSPSATAYVVPVLRSTTQFITVYAEERQNGNTVVFINGHTAQGLTTQPDCSGGACDSGRLVATLEVPLYCNAPTVNVWPATDISLSWHSSPDEYPVSQNFRVYSAVAGGADVYYVVLAADNYQVNVAYTNTALAGGAARSQTVTASCSVGTCEALAITSVLTVDVPGLVASVQINQGAANASEWSPFPLQTGKGLAYCVFNLVQTQVVVTFATGQAVTQSNINCETVNQRCYAGVFTAQVCPDFGCLTNPMVPGPVSVRYLVWSQTQGIAWDVSGAPSAVLKCVVVPALADYGVEIIEGPATCPTTSSCTSCSAQNALTCGAQIGACRNDAACNACLSGGYFSPACQIQNNAALNALKACQQTACPTCVSAQNPFSNGCVRYNIPMSSCAYVANSAQQTQCGPTQVPLYGNFGRVLSAFELFFLPAVNAAGAAPQPGVTVQLATPPTGGSTSSVTYRTYTNQGGAARCYCVLPSYVTVNLNEGAATWGSTPVPCYQQLAPPQAYDCSICDFLTILQFDLTGLPRGASAVLSAGPASSTSAATATAFRLVNWVGAIQNNIAALRSGSGTLPPERFYVTVQDNGAQYTLNNVCSGKTCPFGPFTSVLCLDLTNPAAVTAGKGVCTMAGQGLLTTSLRTANNVEFRSIPQQGCCNGCSASAPPFPSVNQSSTRALRSVRTIPYVTPCGKYAVLRGNYQVVLQEQTVSSPPRAVDCTGATCQLLSLINVLSINTQCGSGAAGSPFNVQPKFDVTLIDTNGVQFRGPQTNVLVNCSTGPLYWSGPTCPDVGQMQINIGTIQSNFGVRFEQLPVDDFRTVYPSPRQHPIVNVPVTCSAASGVTCTVPQASFFSNYFVQSQRGLPDAIPGPAWAAIKFGSTQQNVLRIVQPTQLVAPAVNSFCVLADPAPYYAVNWENYASDGPGRAFTSCAKVNPNRIDACTTSGATILTIPPAQRK